MIAEIMVYVLLVSGILTLSGVVLELVLFGRGYPRRWGWMGVIAFSGLTVVGLLLAPPAPTAAPAEAAKVGEYTATMPFGTVTTYQNPESSRWHPALLPLNLFYLSVKGWDIGIDSLASLTARLAGALERTPIGERGLALLWGFLSILTLTVLVLSARRLRQRTGGLPIESIDGREFAVAESLGPAVVGFLNPKIILPRWLLTTPVESLSVILSHEEEHRRSRDTLLLAGGLGAIVIAPWNLFAWIQLSRLRLAIEMDCDLRVVRRGVPPTLYASVLVEVGSRATYLPLGATALSEPPHVLERRMKTLLRPFKRISRLRATFVGGAAFLLFWLAGSVPAPAKWVVELGASEATPSVSGVESDRAALENPIQSVPAASDIPESGPAGDTDDVLKTICLKESDGETSCVDLWGDPDAHVVCAMHGDGVWGCTEWPGPPSAEQVCVTSSGMYLCGDTAMFHWLTRGVDSGEGNQAPMAYSERAEKERVEPTPRETPVIRTPQPIRQNPIFVPAEVYPSVRNVEAVRAALAREYPATMFEWLSRGPDSGEGSQAPRVNSVLEVDGSNPPSPAASAPPGATPQDTLPSPTLTPVEVYPSVRNVESVRAALVREYPAALRAERIGGMVVMWVFVTATGAVADCRVGRSSGYPDLDGAALRVCRVYEFVPARNGDRPVPVWVTVPVLFNAR